MRSPSTSRDDLSDVSDHDLTSLNGLLAAVAAYAGRIARERPAVLEGREPRAVRPDEIEFEAGTELGDFTGTYCGRCGELRRMNLVAEDSRCVRLSPRQIASTRRTLEELGRSEDPLAFAVGGPPPVFSATCVQCKSRISLVVHAGPPVEIIVLGSRGISSPQTPPPVAFYLDQAYRSRSRGAHTAAAAMYRAALEQLLEEQGFPGNTLRDRIQAVIDAEPAWLAHLDEPLMTALRRLGNRAVHGDLAEQAGIDRALVHDAEHLLSDVLDEIYEAPARRAARRERFLASGEGAAAPQ